MGGLAAIVPIISAVSSVAGLLMSKPEPPQPAPLPPPPVPAPVPEAPKVQAPEEQTQSASSEVDQQAMKLRDQKRRAYSQQQTATLLNSGSTGSSKKLLGE